MTYKTMHDLTDDELVLIADAVALLDPIDEEGEEDGAKAEMCEDLELRFRMLALA